MLTESDLKMVIRPKAPAKARVIGSDGPRRQGQGNRRQGIEGRSGESHGAGHEKKNIPLVN